MHMSIVTAMHKQHLTFWFACPCVVVAQETNLLDASPNLFKEPKPAFA